MNPLSKELLSEVLLTVKKIDYIDTPYGKEVIAWKGISIEGNKCTGAISIYKLAHKCKQWAKSKGYVVIIVYHFDTISVNLILNEVSVYASPSMSILTEIDAISKACEWIMEKVK